MAITRDSLKTHPYKVGAPAPVAFVQTLRGEHEILTPTPPALPNTAPRIDCTWNPDATNPQMLILTAAANPLGDTYYLPYDNNKISSLRLPDPPPGPVTQFLTANMSGCKFYIDSIAGSADLMVYHANARATAPMPDHSPVDSQTGGALAELTRLHNAAQGDYAAAPYNLVLNNVGSLQKSEYYGEGALAEQRKTASRTLLMPGLVHGHAVTMVLNPEFWGGCSIFGFYNGGWRFYYQTWGAVEYDRPDIQGRAATAKAVLTLHWNQLHKVRTEGTRHGLDVRYAKVVDQRRFYP